MAAAVAISSVLALSLTPMMASKILKPAMDEGRIARAVQWLLELTQRLYRALLASGCSRRGWRCWRCSWR
jgi:multidrug efflux pump